MQPLLNGEDIDQRLNWTLGRAERRARRGKLPHVILPDGSIRFEWSDIERVLVRHRGIGGRGGRCHQRWEEPR